MKKTLLIAAMTAMLSMMNLAHAGNNNRPDYSNMGDVNTTNNNTTIAAAGVINNNDVNTNITNDVRNNASAYVNANNTTLVSTGDVKTSVSTGDVAVSTGDVSTASYSGGNTQQVTVTDSGKVHYSGKYTVKNVPDVAAANVYPTSPCMGSSSVGGSGVGFGFNIGSSWTDDECGIRETARSFSGMGMQEDALAVMCSSKYAAVAPSCAKKD